MEKEDEEKKIGGSKVKKKLPTRIWWFLYVLHTYFSGCKDALSVFLLK